MNRNALLLGLGVLALGGGILSCSGTDGDASSGKAPPDPGAPAESPAPPAAEAVVAQQLAGYPLDACVVSGQKLGSMGEPYNHVFEGRLVRFCCDGCIEEFEGDAAAYLARIDEAAAAQP